MSIVFFLQLSCLSAQNPLDIRVNLVLEEVSLENALFELLEQENVNLSFSNAIIPRNKVVSIATANALLSEVLDELLEGTDLTYKVIANQVIIERIRPTIVRKFTLSGFIRDAESGEAIIGANIYDPELLIGTTTNEYGFYSLTLPSGKRNVRYSYLGYNTEDLFVELTKNIVKSIDLQGAYLSEIVVIPTRDSFFFAANALNFEDINLEEMEVLPSLGGETDVIRITHALPGVQTGGDGFGNISVRGGNVDQNLFLLDGVPIYNSTHTFGVFSVFNSSAIRSTKFYKGVFPAKYGGRISSVLDVQTKEGNRKRNVLETDIGLTSGKLTVEGPIFGKKSSYFISGRRALFDFYTVPITRNIRAEDGIDGFIAYHFYDLNVKFNHQASEKDHFYVSYYRGGDELKDKNDEVISQQEVGDVFFGDDNEDVWGNTVASFRWNHVFNNKLFGNATATYTRFFYDSKTTIDIRGVRNDTTLFSDVLFYRYQSNNRDLALKLDFDYRPNQKHSIAFGLSAIQHEFQPGVITIDEAARFDSIDIDTVGRLDKDLLRSFEFDAYIQDEIKIGAHVEANIGLRYTGLFVENEWIGTLQPRLLLNFFPKERLSYHFAVGWHTQNVHLLTVSSLGLPKDLWVSATQQRGPQQSLQVVFGFDRQLKKGYSFGAEGYYKTLKNILAFPDVVLEDVDAFNWQNAVVSGEGWSYGAEFLLRKQSGRTTGWVGYTLSWSERQFGKEINRGNRFAARLDRRHIFNIQVAHRINKKLSLSAGWHFSTGEAYTLPIREYEVIILPSANFSEIQFIPAEDIEQKNGNRLPNIHRLDLGLNYEFEKGKLRHVFKLGTYNTYNHKNPLYRNTRTTFQADGTRRKDLVQVTLFPIFPTLRYKVQFL